MLRRIFSPLMVLGLGVAVGPAVIFPAATSAATSAATTSNVLLAGESLVSETAFNTITSRSGRFSLSVWPGSAEVDEQDVDAAGDVMGGPLWSRYDGSRVYTTAERTRLVLQRDGNLVLYNSAQRVLWNTRTAGSGSSNRLIMQDNGDLVLYTSVGHALWHTATTPRFLPSGSVMTSGQTYVNREAEAYPPYAVTSMTMQGNGDLVIRCDGAVSWHSRTYVPGSHLSMQRDGNLVIYTPGGKAVWSSGTYRAGPGTWAELTASDLIVERQSGFTDMWFSPVPKACE